MARSILYMSMSLDGFITGPDDVRAAGSGRAATGCTSGSASGRTSPRRG